MRVLVFGGDGSIGWPVALRLSAAGHEVVVVDNFARRGADAELQAGSLTPIRSLNDRVAAWRELGGAPVGVAVLDAAQDYDELRATLAQQRPDAVVHLAGQRAAPYSMRTATHKRYTVDNNVSATHNLLAALAETRSRSHLVHLGSLGAGRSVAHVTQALDGPLLDFYAHNDGLRITQLRVGVVWGTQTRETARDERLVNRFDYDGDYGTVLNRFLAQAAIGEPLQVHGPGTQARPLIHLEDVVGGLEAALEEPPHRGDGVRVLARATEVRRVGELARIVADRTGGEVVQVPDPRREVVTDDPPGEDAVPPGPGAVRVADGPLDAEIALARRYSERIDRRRIPATARWSPDGERPATAAPA